MRPRTISVERGAGKGHVCMGHSLSPLASLHHASVSIWGVHICIEICGGRPCVTPADRQFLCVKVSKILDKNIFAMGGMRLCELSMASSGSDSGPVRMPQSRPLSRGMSGIRE